MQGCEAISGIYAQLSRLDPNMLYLYVFGAFPNEHEYLHYRSFGVAEIPTPARFHANRPRPRIA